MGLAMLRAVVSSVVRIENISNASEGLLRKMRVALDESEVNASRTSALVLFHRRSSSVSS